MPAYTLDQITAMLGALDERIAITEKEQAYHPGGSGGAGAIQRGALAAMYSERLELRREYDRLEALALGSSTNRITFGGSR